MCVVSCVAKPEEESVESYFGLGWEVFEEMVLEAYKEAMS